MVTDVNDNDPVFNPAEYSEFDFMWLVPPIVGVGVMYIHYYIFLPLAASIEENTISTQPLLTVTATDADSNVMGYGTVTYSIEDDDGTFTINNMGEISVNMTLDRETL